MKLCVIGNSHVAMLVRASREQPPDGTELTFFAHPGRGPEGVRLRDGQLRAVTRRLRRGLTRFGMPEVLELAAFDAFVLVGMTASAFSLQSMLGSHRVFGWPAAPKDGGRPLMSEAALEAELVQVIAENLAADFVARIRRISAAPVLVVPQPGPSETVARGRSRHPGLRRILRAGQGGQVSACLTRAHARAFDGAGLHVLAQPEETVAHGFLTAERFMQGGGRLNPGGRQPQEDILHANATYGALVLEQIADAMAKIREKSALQPA